jgi:hypothetical protein
MAAWSSLMLFSETSNAAAAALRGALERSNVRGVAVAAALSTSRRFTVGPG